MRISPPEKLKNVPEEVGAVPIRNLSKLFVLKTKSFTLVVPIKSLAPIVFPERYQKFPASADAEIPLEIAVFTNAVLAICVSFVADAAVGAVGVPVKIGDARFALLVDKVLSCVWTLLVAPVR